MTTTDRGGVSIVRYGEGVVMRRAWHDALSSSRVGVSLARDVVLTGGITLVGDPADATSHRMKLSLFTVLAVSAVALAGCQSKPEKANDAPNASPVAVTSAAVPTATATPVSLSGDGTGALTLAWKVAPASATDVAASLVVGDQTMSLGRLDAQADDSPAGPSNCAMKNLSPTSTRLSCGGTPAYNFYTATLNGGSLVVTLTKGVDGDPGSEKTTEILRKPTTATSLHATGPASPALYGNCRPGFVQKTADGPCMRQCPKGSECKASETCEMTAVQGLDGPHKVHACVAPGK